MKFISVLVMALLLAGIGSAQNYMPEFTMEPGADLSMFDGSSGNFNLHDGNITADWPLYEGCLIYNLGSFTHAKDPFGSSLYAGEDGGAAIQAANDYLVLNYDGGKITVMQGNYNVTPIDLSQHIKLVGAVSPWRQPADASTPLLNRSSAHNVKFFVTNTTEPAITISGGNEIANIAFAYPDQETNDTPTAYPETIRCIGGYGGYHLHDIDLGNAYIGVNCTVQHSGLVATDIFGYPLYTGFMIDLGKDSDYFTRCHFVWSYYPERGSVLSDFVWDNATCFDVGEADNSFFTNCFCYGYKTLFDFDETVGVQITGCSADGGNPCVTLLNCTHITINGGSFGAGTADMTTNPTQVCTAIALTGGGHNKVVGATISASGDGITSSGSTGDKISDCLIPSWGWGATGGYASGIKSDSNDISITGNILHAGSVDNTIGILINTGNYYTVSDNQVFDTAVWGVATALASTNGIVNDNLAVNCVGGIVNNSDGTIVEDNNVIWR